MGTSMCFIGGKCLDDGTHAPMGRSGVDTSMKCDVASSTTAYTEVKGYMLNMATFDGGSFFANGSAMAPMTTASMTTDMIASMKTTVATRDATVVELRMAKEAAEQDGAAKAATIEAKDELIVDLEANLSEERSEDKMPTWAIAIIVVIGAVLLLVIAILGVVVSREQQGKPIFVQKNSAATSGSSKI